MFLPFLFENSHWHLFIYFPFFLFFNLLWTFKNQLYAFFFKKFYFLHRTKVAGF